MFSNATSGLISAVVPAGTPLLSPTSPLVTSTVSGSTTATVSVGSSSPEFQLKR
jgi:hypothetical protein